MEEEQTYEVHIERAAVKEVNRLHPVAKQRIGEAIDALATEPRPHGAKALTGPWAGYYRLRVSAPGGEYRIIWTVDDKARRVEVARAGPREGKY
jgi:mRNA interferase RelE/StbE